jgi:hypothetical protein
MLVRMQEEKELLETAGGSVNECSYHANQYGGFPKN